MASWLFHGLRVRKLDQDAHAHTHTHTTDTGSPAMKQSLIFLHGFRNLVLKPQGPAAEAGASNPNLREPLFDVDCA